MSTVLPRFDEFGELVKYFNTKLSKVCVRNNVTFFDLCGSFMNMPSLYGLDGLHFNHEGYFTLSQALQGYLERQFCGIVPLRHVPNTMMPPLTPQKSKNMNENKKDAKQECKTVPNSATQKTGEKVRMQISRGSILITEVEDDGNHFFRRGWKRLPPVNTYILKRANTCCLSCTKL